MRKTFTLPPIIFILFTLFVSAQTGRKVELMVTTPLGKTQTLDQSRMIVAAFNQPMVPLQEVPADEGSGPLLIQPSIAGKYRWQGTGTLSFIPASALPYSTEFLVKIPAGTKSISGQILEHDYVWNFETPRPRITLTNPANNERFIELNHTIFLQFNQPVDPQIVSKWISIEEHAGKTISYIGYTAGRPEHNSAYSNQEILLRPTELLKKGGRYVVRCKGGLIGTEGPLPMESDYVFSFTTYNEFSFLHINENLPINPSGSLVLTFSNPVTKKEVLEHIQIFPHLDLRENVEEDYDSEGTDYGESASLPYSFKPEQHYYGIVTPGLEDQFKNVLRDTARFDFWTSSYTPYVRMTTGPGVLEAYEAHRYPVKFLNIDSVRFSLGRINPEKIVPMMLRLDYSRTYQLAWNEAILEWAYSKSEDEEKFQVSRIWDPKIPRNTPSERDINLDEVLGKQHLGVALVQVNPIDRKKDTEPYLKALVEVTNLGITAKFSPDDNLIWVTTLKDAAPVSGAAVEIRNDSNEVVWKGYTDSDGLAKSPGWGKLGFAHNVYNKSGDDEESDEWWYSGEHPRQWVVVRYRDDVAFTNSEWNEGIQPWIFGVPVEWRPEFEPCEGQLFTDRGLYRAGEQVDLKGIVRVRKNGSLHIPPSMHFRLVIQNSRNEEIFSSTPEISRFGSFSEKLFLKGSAALGYYSMRLETEKEQKGKKVWAVIATNDFRVEAFRPVEFEVTAQTEKKSYIIGDTVSSIFSAKYLFGAPLQNAAAKWRASISPRSWRPEGYDNYFFGSMGWLSRYRSSNHRILSTQETTVDRFGNLSTKTSLNVGEIFGTVNLNLEAEVQSPSRQAIAGRTSVIVHGGEYYIGISPASTFVKSDTVMSYKIVTLTPEGQFFSGVPLSGKLYQRIWLSVRKAESGGRYYWQSEVQDSLVDNFSVVSTNGWIERGYLPQKAGLYYIVLEGQDRRGNKVAGEAYFYASGPSYVPWARSNDDRIELITNKQNYKPGETASIIVKSPYEKAIALVSIERNGILNHFVTTLVGSAPQIDLPIPHEYLPNVFVSVVLLQGRVARPAESREADVGRPSFKIGYAVIGVSPLEKLLNVHVASTKPDYRPGDTVEVAISTKDASGRGVPAEVTLSVADLGVLNLINYRLPNVFDRFYSQQSLAVVTTESRLNLVKQRNAEEKGEDEGGGGGEENAPGYDAEGIRKVFRPSAYWNPAVTTDAVGNASVRFKLPDNLTSFEIMAVAQTVGSEFGYDENSFRVNKLLLMQSALPRFARVGDEFEGGVIVVNFTSVEKDVHLVTAVKGIRFTGQDTMNFTLRAGEGREIRHSFKAENVGNAVFTFRAWAGNDRDGLQWTIPIQLPRLRETVALFESQTEQKAAEVTAVPKDIYKELGDIEVTLSSSALVGLEQGIAYLFGYPYGCLEQRLSQALPIIMAKDIVDAFKFESLKEKNYRAAAEKVLDEVPMFQRENGGFAYWKNTEYTSPYLSAFTMYSLLQAQRNGYTVDKKMMDRGFEYLRKLLNGTLKDDWYDYIINKCTSAFILYTMALNGQPDYGYMEQLYAERAQLPIFARAYLLKALVTAKGNGTMISDLARDLSNMAKIAPTTAHYEEQGSAAWYWIYHSNVRTTALVMQALVETQPENPIIPKVTRWLVEQQKIGCWRTTQENLYVIDALVTYYRKYENEEPNFHAQVLLEGGKLVDSFFKGRELKTTSGKIALSELVPGTSYNWEFTKDGPGRMYRTMRMNYYPRSESKAKEEGLAVVKEISDPSNPNSPLGISKAGSIAKITITVSSSQDRHFVVVDDPIPAGLEIIDRTFQTTATMVDEGNREYREWWRWNPFDHREFYDDRANFFADYLPAGIHTVSYLVRATRYGSFQMPSTRAEGMYEPEVFGQTASKIFTIQ